MVPEKNITNDRGVTKKYERGALIPTSGPPREKTVFLGNGKRREAPG